MRAPMFIRGLWVALIFHGAFLLPLAPASATLSGALTTAEIFRRANPSVAVIRTYDEKDLPISQGSGFIIDAEGRSLLITNQHVVKGASRIAIKISGRWLTAGRLHREDMMRDLAVFVLPRRIPGLRLARALPSVGEAVVVIGSPEGLENTVSEGIVSGIREILSRHAIQTTAPVSHGSSGGPMLNRRGEVIGVVRAMMIAGQNLNFGIPASELAELLTPRSTRNEPSERRGLSFGDARVAEAWNLILAEKFEEARTLLEAATQHKRENAESWMLLGFCYSNLNRHQDAITAYRETVRIDPDNADVWNNLGVAYGSINQHEDEIAAYREAIRIRPDFADFWSNLGKTYSDINQHQDAIAAYREAIRIDPDHTVSWIRLGMTYSDINQHQNAIAAYREAIRIRPDYADAWFNLGLSAVISGDHETVRKCLLRLDRLDPTLATRLRMSRSTSW